MLLITQDFEDEVFMLQQHNTIVNTKITTRRDQQVTFRRLKRSRGRTAVTAAAAALGMAVVVAAVVVAMAAGSAL